MGHVFTEIELSNPRNIDLAPVRVKALADTGALMLRIPEHIALQLKLETESIREVSVADDQKYLGSFFPDIGNFDRLAYEY